MWAWILFWTLGTLLFDSYLAFGLMNQLASLAYPTTTATIRSSELEVGGDSEGTTYRAAVRYRYVVDGREYENDRRRYPEISTGSGRAAKAAVAKYPVGAVVPVRYNPWFPSASTLETGLNGVTLELMVFMAPFNVVMLGGWIVLAGCYGRGPGRQPELLAERARVVDGALALQLRPRYFRMSVVAGAIGGMAFVLVFVLAFGFGMDPPVLPPILGIGVLAIAAWLAWRVATNKLRQSVLKIKPGRHGPTLTNPASVTKAGPISFSNDEIRSITVSERVVLSGDGGSNMKYDVVVRPATGVGVGRATEGKSWVLASSDSRDRAEALRTWLAKNGIRPDDPGSD